MTNSLKLAIFSLVGYVTFTLISIFFPFISIVSLAFGLMMGISLMAYVFEKLATKHHFFLTMISSAIGFVVTIIISVVFSATGINETDDMIASLSFSIVENLAAYCFLTIFICLIIYLVDLLLGACVKLNKQRNNAYFKWVRLSVYCSLFLAFFAEAMISWPGIFAILQIILLPAFVVVCLAISFLVFKQTICSIRAKLVISNVLCLMVSAVFGLYCVVIGDGTSMLFDLKDSTNAEAICRALNVSEIGAFVVYKMVTVVLVLLLLVQMLVYTVKGIMAPKTSFIKNFVPILYSAIGLLISGVAYYLSMQGIGPFYFEKMIIPYYIGMLIFSVGVAVSFMVTVYKIIFLGNPGNDINKINIDMDVESTLGEAISEIVEDVQDVAEDEE